MRFKRSVRGNRQSGYVLLAILFALTVLIVGLAVAAPRAAVALQRTKEDELIRRGQQYALAIRRFYKKFGRYPSNIDQLENTNNIRFLRRRYLDPLTGKAGKTCNRLLWTEDHQHFRNESLRTRFRPLQDRNQPRQ